MALIYDVDMKVYIDVNLRHLLITSGLVYLDVDKQHRFVFGGSLLQDALLLPHNTHESVVGLERG